MLNHNGRKHVVGESCVMEKKNVSPAHNPQNHSKPNTTEANYFPLHSRPFTPPLPPLPCPLVLDLNVVDGGVLSGHRTPGVQRASLTDVRKLLLAHGSGIVLPVRHRVLGGGGTAVDVILDAGNGGRDGDGRGRGRGRVGVGDGGLGGGRSVTDGDAGLVDGDGVVGHDDCCFGIVGERV
jgi:hypothetical protein